MNDTKVNFSTLCAVACLVLAALYWAAVTLLHEAISNNIVVPFKNMLGAVPTEYAFVVLTLSCLGALLWLARCHALRECAGKSGTARGVENVEAHGLARGAGGVSKGRASWCWLVLLIATVLCSVFLMVTRIEMAHFPQYAILAALLRLGGLSPTSAYLAGQCGSIVDEGRQYLLHPRFTGYFDWNDLIINSVGLCIGLLLVRQGDYFCTLPNALRQTSRLVARMSAGLLALASCALLAGLALGYVRAYVPLASGQPPNPFPLVEGSRVLALFLRDPPTFWQAGPFGQYHVMGVAEGMIVYPLCSVLLFACCFYRKNT